MFTNRGLKAEITKRIISKFSLMAHADEGDTGEDSGSSVNYEALIAKARKEEKDKLYSRIQGLENENKTLVQSCNNYLTKIAGLEAKLEKATENPADPQEIKNLEEKVKTLEAEKEALNLKVAELEKEDTERENSLRSTITAELENKYKEQQEVMKYKAKLLEENKDKLLTTVASDISGDTKEELDKSLEAAISKSLAIKKEVGLVDENGEPIKKKPTGTKPPKPKMANPANNNGEESYDTDYIRNLDPRSEEYAELRKKLGLK